MKTDIHPEMKPAVIHCSCGAQWETFSTREDLHVDICAKCHPFFTGEERFLDTEGRIEIFNRKYSKAKGNEKPERAKAAKASAK